MSDRNPFVQLFLSRLREFMREPEVVFWVFGFPILLAIGLGVAFRNKPPDKIVVGVVDGQGAAEVVDALPESGGFQVVRVAPGDAADRLRLGKVAIVAVHETQVIEPGARYIDFLIPGLLGMNIMSGGMWGVGFVLVEMRSRKLMKRLIATPMRRSDFLGAMMASRMVLVFLELVLLLFFGWIVFSLVIRGSLWLIAFLALLGAFVFSGLGLLVASRARKIETVSGLMNLVMLPMFVFSGIFFSSDRFPAAIQPLIKALPLTALNDALRAAILEGADFRSQLGRIALMLAWGTLSFVLALRLFRW